MVIRDRSMPRDMYFLIAVSSNTIALSTSQDGSDSNIREKFQPDTCYATTSSSQEVWNGLRTFTGLEGDSQFPFAHSLLNRSVRRKRYECL